MSNRVPNVKIPAALSKKYEFRIMQDTVSTASFLQSQPDTYLWTVPFQDIDINLDTFTRLAPLNLPTFGRVTVSHRAFFVKFKDLFDGWNDAYTRNLYIAGHVNGTRFYNTLANSQVMCFTANDLINCFDNPTNGLANVTPTLPYDIVIKNSSVSPVTSRMYQLTKRGRLFLKVLNGLGYTLIPDENTTEIYNAFALLAYVKILVEYYYPSNWKNNSIYTDVVSILKSSKVASAPADLFLGQDELARIAKFLEYANGYDQDYFVSSYTNHVVDNDNAFPAIQVNDDLGVVSQTSPNNPPSKLNQFTQNAIDTLQRITAYFKINSLAGTDAFDRLYAMFGYRSDSGRAIHFGSDEYMVQIGDIQSTADTTADGGVSLASYAGKGVGGSKDRHFKFKTDGDCGIIIVVKTVTPHIGYVQGYDRHNVQVNVLDFWHPLFDGLGDQAISKGELFSMPFGHTDALAAVMESRFGFIPRFAHYKVGHDLCIGDFNLLSRNTGMNAWHLFREIGIRNTIPSTSLDFACASDENQYLRIFQLNGSKEYYEPFNCVSNYNIRFYAPMRPLFDDTCLDQIEHQDNGHEGEFSTGGSKLY